MARRKLIRRDSALLDLLLLPFTMGRVAAAGTDGSKAGPLRGVLGGLVGCALAFLLFAALITWLGVQGMAMKKPAPQPQPKPAAAKVAPTPKPAR